MKCQCKNPKHGKSSLEQLNGCTILYDEKESDTGTCLWCEKGCLRRKET